MDVFKNSTKISEKAAQGSIETGNQEFKVLRYYLVFIEYGYGTDPLQ